MLRRLTRYDNLLYAAILLLYVSYFIAFTATIPVVLLLLLYLFHNHFKIQFKVNGYIVYLVIFTAFCYISCIWAVDVSYVISYSNRILRIIVGILVLFLCVQNEKTSDILLKPMVTGGYIVIVYAISYYGINQLRQLMLSDDIRLSNDITNVNVLGMCAAFTCILHIYYAIRDKRWNISHLLLIPAVLFLSATGSRKGLLVLAIGIMGLILWNSLRKEIGFNALLRILVAFITGIIILYMLSNLSVFNGIRERMMSLLAMVSGEGDVDNSLTARSAFIRIGIRVFKDHPILGVGINNARIFNYRDVYLHNNYVELLADGGIVGFGIYYSLYIVLLIKLWNTKDKKFNNSGICLIILISTLIIHYGHVAYRMGYEYYLLLAIYIEIRNNKNSETQEIIPPSFEKGKLYE